MRNPFGSVHQFVLFDELVPEKSLRESLQREPLALASAHRDTFRAELALALRKYRGYGCPLMQSFCGRNEDVNSGIQENKTQGDRYIKCG